MPEDGVEGTIMRGADGSLFFLRPELLEAARVTEPEMHEFLSKVVDEHAPRKRQLRATQIDESVVVTSPRLNASDLSGLAAESTVMCPGTVNDGDFEVLPAERFGGR